MSVQTPVKLLQLVWPLPRSLATTSGISVDVFSSPYLDVSVQAVPHAHLWIQCTLTGSSPAGLPHSEIPGSMDICSSPRLIAACHVFHRLLMPRHSPCALISLTVVGGSSISFPSGFAESSLIPLRLLSAAHPLCWASPLLKSGKNDLIWLASPILVTFLRLDLCLVLIIEKVLRIMQAPFGFICSNVLPFY